MEDEEQKKEKESTVSQLQSRTAYVALCWIATLLAIILRFGVAKHFLRIYSFKECNNDVYCAGNQAVYRVSFGLFLFFTMMMLICCCTPSFHVGWWWLKVPAFLALIAVEFAIPAPAFRVYAEISRVGSVLFLLVQIVVLIDLAYDLHDYLVDPLGTGEMPTPYKVLYILLSVGFQLLGVGGCVAMYLMYKPCALNTAFITIALIVPVLLTCLSLFERIGKGLLAPSLVYAYCVFLTWQSISSNPNTECGLIKSTMSGPPTTMLIVNLAILLFTFTYTGHSASSQAPGVFGGKVEEETTPKYWLFHLVWALASLYLAMLLTNWGDPLSAGNLYAGKTSMWVKIVSVWLILGLFLWSLIAPVCCPNRDFNDQDNRFR